MRLVPKPVGRTASKFSLWTSCLVNRNFFLFFQATAKSFIDNKADCSLLFSLGSERFQRAKSENQSTELLSLNIRLFRGIHYFDMRDWDVNQKIRAAPMRCPVRGRTGIFNLQAFPSPRLLSSPQPSNIYIYIFFFFGASPILARLEKWIRFSPPGNAC